MMAERREILDKSVALAAYARVSLAGFLCDRGILRRIRLCAPHEPNTRAGLFSHAYAGAIKE
jgi:hypothetical protein